MIIYLFHLQDDDDDEMDEAQVAAQGKFITKFSRLPNNKGIHNWGHFFKLHLVQKVPKRDYETIW